MNLLIRWFASAAAVWAATQLVPGIRVEGGVEALLAIALIMGLVNALVRPLVKMLACGLVVLTLGLILFVINAAMLYVTSFLAAELGYVFTIDRFTSALLGSVVISVVSWLLSVLLTDGDRD